MAILIATVGGIGSIPKLPGTAASLVTAGLFVVTRGSWRVMAVCAGTALLAGAFSIGRAERAMGKKDPNAIVVDEVAGMALAVAGHPLTWVTAVAGFAGFRLFDIWKPFPIRQIQVWPGAWGVLADDVLAAVYTQILLFGVFWIAK